MDTDATAAALATGDHGASDPAGRDAEEGAALEALLQYLKKERGFDFTGYKRASLMRRVERRMADIDVQGFEAYHDHLLMHPDEFTSLFNTVLINVTGFFRDPEAWTYLREVALPPILARRVGQPIRVWCAGCASGEEAYTMAMVLAEMLGVEEFRSRVKIYATDVDEEALTVARQATYGEREVAGVPEELREKYFERQGQRFLFRKELRRAVIFGRNDLVQDAPISHVDVLSCRNTLMYLNAETQALILQRMHFALRTDGILFLGKAEMLLSHGGLFRPLEIKRRIFTKVADDGRIRQVFTPRGSGGPPAVSDETGQLRDAGLMASPAAQVILDREGRMVLSTTRAATLFGLTPRDIGRPIQDLEVSYRPIELRTHIDQAVGERRQVWVRDVAWTRGANDSRYFDISVQPLNDDGGVHLGVSVVFNDVTASRHLQHELEFANRQLETAYEELQSTNEELETTNEELQSTVEELETTNEELQSTNEELETMNEELQSMNDELHMLGETQREQQEHFYQLNQFMVSVLGSIDSGIVVVDQDVRVLAWNAKATDLWGIRADEAKGELLYSLDIGLPLETVRPALESQLSGAPTAPAALSISGVNRRGRDVQVKVRVTRLAQDGAQPPGALLVMDVVPQA
jgi:two-component system, chemotaxis family, CheB/CheR fusion protein